MFVRVVSLMLLGAFATGTAETPPRVSLNVPEAFRVKLAVSHYRKGQDVLVSDPYRETAAAALTRYIGHFGDPDADQDHNHGWFVDIYAAASRKVIMAYTTAKEGYEANLNECPEFLNCGDTSYMFARFERKHFRWGDAVSFLRQSTQDTGIYVPHNGHLTYEVWGVTRNHRFTVVANVSVSHPKLAGWIAKTPELRDARSLDALKRDKDYKRVERCRPGEFEPSLTEFDQMLDTLVIR